MPLSLAQRFINLGMVSQLAKEYASQLERGVYNWRRLMWVSMPPALAKYVTDSLAAGTYNPNVAAEKGMPPAIAQLTTDLWFVSSQFNLYQGVADLINDRYALPVLGQELLNPASWVGSSSGGTASGSNVGGTLTLVGDNTNNYRFDASIVTEAGKSYAFIFDIEDAPTSFRAGTTAGGVNILPSQAVQPGKRAYFFTAQGATTFLRFAQTSTTPVRVLSISVKEVALSLVSGAYPKRAATFGEFLRFEQAIDPANSMRLWELHDDFQRPDGPLGTAPTGQAWSYIADAPTRTIPSIVGFKVQTYDSGQPSTACYNFNIISKPVKSMRARISFAPGADNGRSTLISTYRDPYPPLKPWEVPQDPINNAIRSGSIHINYGTTDVQNALFHEPPQYNYVSTNITYPGVLAKDGTEYIVGWDLDGDEMWFLMPLGPRVQRVSDLYQQENGRRVVFEHYWQTGQCQVRYHEVWAS